MANWSDKIKIEEKTVPIERPLERTTTSVANPSPSKPLTVPEYQNKNFWSYLTDTSYLIDLGFVLRKKKWYEIAPFILSTLSFLVASVSRSAEYTRLIDAIVNYFSRLLSKSYWYYIFHINPNNVSFVERKLQTLHEYGWGYYDLEYYGDSLTTISVKGTTGLLFPPPEVREIVLSDKRVGEAVLKQTGYDARLSVAWLKFNILHRFYKDSTQRLLFIYYSKVYFGFLESFTFAQDAENPRRINYEFSFRAFPNAVVDLWQLDFSGIPKIRYLLDPSAVRETVFMNKSQLYQSGQSEWV